jgi:hypothetical protein
MKVMNRFAALRSSCVITGTSSTTTVWKFSAIARKSFGPSGFRQRSAKPKRATWPTACGTASLRPTTSSSTGAPSGAPAIASKAASSAAAAAGPSGVW